MLEDIGSICQYFRGVVTGKDANGLQDSRILVTYNFEYKGDFQEAVEELVGHLTVNIYLPHCTIFVALLLLAVTGLAVCGGMGRRFVVSRIPQAVFGVMGIDASVVTHQHPAKLLFPVSAEGIGEQHSHMDRDDQNRIYEQSHLCVANIDKCSDDVGVFGRKQVYVPFIKPWIVAKIHQYGVESERHFGGIRNFERDVQAAVPTNSFFHTPSSQVHPLFVSNLLEFDTLFRGLCGSLRSLSRSSGGYGLSPDRPDTTEGNEYAYDGRPQINSIKRIFSCVVGLGLLSFGIWVLFCKTPDTTSDSGGWVVCWVLLYSVSFLLAIPFLDTGVFGTNAWLRLLSTSASQQHQSDDDETHIDVPQVSKHPVTGLGLWLRPVPANLTKLPAPTRGRVNKAVRVESDSPEYVPVGDSSIVGKTMLPSKDFLIHGTLAKIERLADSGAETKASQGVRVDIGEITGDHFHIRIRSSTPIKSRNIPFLSRDTERNLFSNRLPSIYQIERYMDVLGESSYLEVFNHQLSSLNRLKVFDLFLHFPPLPGSYTSVINYGEGGSNLYRNLKFFEPWLICVVGYLMGCYGLWYFKYGPYHWLGLCLLLCGLACFMYGAGLTLNASSDTSQLSRNPRQFSKLVNEIDQQLIHLGFPKTRALAATRSLRERFVEITSPQVKKFLQIKGILHLFAKLSFTVGRMGKNLECCSTVNHRLIIVSSKPNLADRKLSTRPDSQWLFRNGFVLHSTRILSIHERFTFPQKFVSLCRSAVLQQNTVFHPAIGSRGLLHYEQRDYWPVLLSELSPALDVIRNVYDYSAYRGDDEKPLAKPLKSFWPARLLPIPKHAPFAFLIGGFIIGTLGAVSLFICHDCGATTRQVAWSFCVLAFGFVIFHIGLSWLT